MKEAWPALVLWDGEFSSLSLYFGAFLLFTFVAVKFCKRRNDFQVPARDISKGHRWCRLGPFPQTVYCNVCEMLIMDGLQCDSCGLWSDEHCLKKANQTIPCKSLSWLGASFKHHWIKGNLLPGNNCIVCEEECGHDPELCDYRCCWCQSTVHTECISSAPEICDLGPYRDFIVPPNCVRLRLVGWKGRRHLIVGEVRPPASKTWSPLIVIANRKSGSNDGENILRAFRCVLNPAQVIDLHELPPESGLEWCHLVKQHVCRVLVAGGDGTVGWVLTTISKLNLQPQPQVAILPMGTGNDLSRVLGWGDGTAGELNVDSILHQIEKAKVVALDRWNIKITPSYHLGLRLPSKQVFMNNYASVGVDALVTLNFHKTRESSYYFFGSRLINKLLFVSYGTKDIWERECKNLHRKVNLWLDNRKIVLPEVEAIVFLNIECWGAGVRPWILNATPQTPVQRQDDGLLEVFGVYSSFHIAQMQVGLSDPVRIGQARTVKIQLLEKMPMQVDGEPWEQNPAILNISYHSQASMLAFSSKKD